MTFNGTTNKGQGYTFTVPAKSWVQSATLSVIVDDNSRFLNSLVVGTATYVDGRVRVDFTSSEVDSLKTFYFKVVAQYAGNSYLLDDGKLEYYVPEKTSIPESDLDFDPATQVELDAVDAKFAGKVNISTYNSGMAAKQDKSTLKNDILAYAEIATQSELDVVNAKIKTPAELAATTEFKTGSITAVRDSGLIRSLRLRLSGLRIKEANPGVYTADTVTTSWTNPGGTSPIASGSPVRISYAEPKGTVLGGRLTRYGSTDAGVNANNAGAPTGGPIAYEFDYYGSDIAIRLINQGGPTSAAWMWVDGQPIANNGSQIGVAVSNAACWYRATFSAGAKWRRIRVNLWGFALVGADVGILDSMTPVRRPALRISILGDSWGDGATGATTAVEGYSATLSRLLNAEVFVHSQGGTGYVTDAANGRTRFTDATRINQILADQPDLVIVQGSSNDDAATSSAIATASASVYAALSPFPVFVVGPPYLGQSPGNRVVVRDAMLSSAAAASNVIGFLDQLDLTRTAMTSAAPGPWVTGTSYVPGDSVTFNGTVYVCRIAHTAGGSFSVSLFNLATWLYGTGTTSAPNGTGNSDVLRFDSAHPSQAGHDGFGRLVAERILSVSNGLTT